MAFPLCSVRGLEQPVRGAVQPHKLKVSGHQHGPAVYEEIQRADKKGVQYAFLLKSHKSFLWGGREGKIDIKQLLTRQLLGGRECLCYICGRGMRALHCETLTEVPLRNSEKKNKILEP